MKKYIKASEDIKLKESEKLRQHIKLIKKDIAAMAAADSIEDLENYPWGSFRSQDKYIRNSLKNYDSFDDCIDAWLDTYYELLQNQKEQLAKALKREAAIPTVQEQIFGMVDTTDYELVGYSEDEMWFDFQIPAGATAEDTYRFVDAVAHATNAKYSGTGRGGSWTTWNLLTPDGVRIDAGYNYMVKGLWHVVIKDY